MRNAEKLKKLLVNWLTEEYSKEDAEDQIEAAKIEEVKVIIITYDNGIKDIVQVKGKKVTHLNPHR